MKSLLTTDAYKDMFLSKGLELGASSATKALRVLVAPDSDSTTSVFGNRVTFRLPRYHFLNGLALQVELGKIDASQLTNETAGSFGYTRLIGSLIKRIEISIGSYRYVVPEDFVSHYFLLMTSQGELDKKLRYAGGIIGDATAAGNHLGGLFEIPIPSPFEDNMFPTCALSTEILVEVEFKQQKDGVIEDFSASNITGADSAASVSLTKPRLICKVVNTDEAVVSETIARVKSGGIAIPFTNIGYVDTDFTPSSTGAKINLSQANSAGLIHTLLFSIRKADKVRTNNGTCSVIEPRALATNDVTFNVELNNNRLYSNTDIPLALAALELQEKYNGAIFTGSKSYPALSGICFAATSGRDAMKGLVQSGYVDATSTSAFDLNISFTSGIKDTSQYGNNVEWYFSDYQKMNIQVRALAWNCMVVDGNGCRLISA